MSFVASGSVMFQRYEFLKEEAHRTLERFTAMESEKERLSNFTREYRSALKQENPALTFSQATKIIGNEWKAHQSFQPFGIPFTVIVYSELRPLYHVTNREAAQCIVHQRRMRRGGSGMFGGAIYFAQRPEIAVKKARSWLIPNDAVICAMVDLGRSAVLNRQCHHLTKKKMRDWNFHSVTGRQNEGKPTEYAIYDYRRIQIISITVDGEQIWTAGQNQ
jgi:hypothetical protein